MSNTRRIPFVHDYDKVHTGLPVSSIIGIENSIADNHLANDIATKFLYNDSFFGYIAILSLVPGGISQIPGGIETRVSTPKFNIHIMNEYEDYSIKKDFDDYEEFFGLFETNHVLIITKDLNLHLKEYYGPDYLYRCKSTTKGANKCIVFVIHDKCYYSNGGLGLFDIWWKFSMDTERKVKVEQFKNRVDGLRELPTFRF